MIVISWNVRGLNSGPRKKVVHELIRRQGLDVVFLQETKLSVESMQGVMPILWRSGECQCIGALGALGGWHAYGILRRSSLFGGFPLEPLCLWLLLALSQGTSYYFPIFMLLLIFKVNKFCGLTSS